jgi:hypothetical protein
MTWLASPWRWVAIPKEAGLDILRALLNQSMSKLQNALAVPRYEEQTSKTGTTLTLQDPHIVNSDMVVKNYVILRRGTHYTIAGSTITLTTAAVSGDVFLIWYASGSG